MSQEQISEWRKIKVIRSNAQVANVLPFMKVLECSCYGVTLERNCDKYLLIGVQLKEEKGYRDTWAIFHYNLAEYETTWQWLGYFYPFNMIHEMSDEELCRFLYWHRYFR